MCLKYSRISYSQFKEKLFSFVQSADVEVHLDMSGVVRVPHCSNLEKVG